MKEKSPFVQHWRFVLIVSVGFGAAACSLRDAFKSDVDVVARAGNVTLPSDTLAEILASNARIPLRNDLVERWAHRWVEFSLLVERLAAGDSLLDSATVVQAYWPDAKQMLVDHYHDELVSKGVELDSATVDSAYNGDANRLIYHVLVRTTPDMSPPKRDAAHRKAEAIHSRLVNGGSWEAANRESEDPVARDHGGSLGLISHGQMVEPFEDAAFSLAPGAISDVVQTRFGYHVLWRPTLGEKYDEFRDALHDLLVQRMDSVFLGSLEKRWNIEVRPNAPTLMREAAKSPLFSQNSDAVIGSYRGAKFTVSDYLRWLQALPQQVGSNIAGGTDDQLTGFARILIRQETLVREAEEHGMTLTPDEMKQLRERLRNELGVVRTQLGLDSAMATGKTVAEKTAAGDQAVLDYLRTYAKNLQNAVAVPAFLADALLADARWQVSTPALDQVIQRAQAARAQRAANAPLEPPVPAKAADSLHADSTS